MPRRPAPQQLELFTRASDADLVAAPHWQTLPEEARVSLTELMTCLILDHAAGAQPRHLNSAITQVSILLCRVPLYSHGPGT